MEPIQHLFDGFQIAASGMSAERARIDTIARNVANAGVTRSAGGGPYRRQVVHFAPILARAEDGSLRAEGVRVSGVHDDRTTPFERVHEPGHPDADAGGWVTYPNVDVTAEMVDLIGASRAYEANLSVQDSFVRMAERALRLLQ
jgi:flagellar basal-body rod protein FlgC